MPGRLDLYLNRTHELNIEGLLLLFSLLTPSVLLWLKKIVPAKLCKLATLVETCPLGLQTGRHFLGRTNSKWAHPYCLQNHEGVQLQLMFVIFRHFFSSFSYNQVQCYHNYNHNDNTFCLYAKKNTFIKYCKDINTENTQCANTCMCIWSTDPNKWYINKRMLVKPFIKICYRKKRLEIR